MGVEVCSVDCKICDGCICLLAIVDGIKQLWWYKFSHVCCLIHHIYQPQPAKNSGISIDRIVLTNTFTLSSVNQCLKNRPIQQSKPNRYACLESITRKSLEANRDDKRTVKPRHSQFNAYSSDIINYFVCRYSVTNACFFHIYFVSFAHLLYILFTIRMDIQNAYCNVRSAFVCLYLYRLLEYWVKFTTA